MGNGNFKVKCIDDAGCSKDYTMGKEYVFYKGFVITDCGSSYGPFLNFEHFVNWSSSKFVLVEDAITITDILQKCAELQAQGLNVQFSSSYQEISLEHRNHEDCSLICGFTMREIDNLEMIKAMSDYLDKLLEGVNPNET